MPLVSEFNHRPCVLKWLNDKERRDVLPKKSKEQAGLLQCSKKHMKKLGKINYTIRKNWFLRNII